MPFARTYQRGLRRVVALWVAVLVAGLCSTAAFAFTGAAQSVKLAGTWSGSYTGGYSGTFTLHWTQSRSSCRNLRLAWPPRTPGRLVPQSSSPEP